MRQVNQKGEETATDQVQVNLLHFGVRDHTGERDIFPEDNPHTIPRAFAHQLVHSNRATFHDPGVGNGDPTAKNADPAPKAKGKK